MQRTTRTGSEGQRQALLDRAHVASEVLSGLPQPKSRSVRAAVRQVASAAIVCPNHHLGSLMAHLVIDGSGPDPATAVHFRNLHATGSEALIRQWMVESLEKASKTGSYSPIEVIRGALIVDLTHTLTSGARSGIQRVSLNLVRDLSEICEVVTVHWNDSTRTFKRVKVEFDKNGTDGFCLSWGEENGTSILPLDCSYFLPELVPELGRLETTKHHINSGCFGSTTAIVYDLIPIRHPDFVEEGTDTWFLRYLDLVGRFSTLTAISGSTADELSEWFETRGAGSLHSKVLTLPLPKAPLAVRRSNEPLDVHSEGASGGGVHAKRVVIVGSFEPRKNQITSMRACERLWRAGHEFEVILVGSGGWSEDSIIRYVKVLSDAGRPIRVQKRLSDEEFEGLLRSAAAVMYVSLAEGFGLPIAEVRALGVPLVTTRVPAVEELADEAIVLVDPYKSEDIAAGLLEAMRHRRTVRPSWVESLDSWKTYARNILQVIGAG